MSRIGKKPIEIPQGVKVEQKGKVVQATGPLGTLQVDCHPAIGVKIDTGSNQILVSNPDAGDREKKALHGTSSKLRL